MTIGQAVKHLQWRYGNFQNIKVSAKDVQAINKMIEFVNSQTEENVHNNQVAYKLYLNEFREQLKHYGTTVFDNIPQKEISRFISKPLEWHEERFTNFLNDREVDRVTDELDNKKIKDLEDETVKAYIDRIVDGQKAFNPEEVGSNMRIMFSETLRNFS